MKASFTSMNHRYKDMNTTLKVQMKSNIYNEWPLKWMICLIPGAVSMATAIMAILGVFSEPCLLWKGKIVLALLIHPLHFVFAFVVLIFSMVHLDDILDKTVCFRLVTAAITSQWGVMFSTLALSLGRAMQMGSADVELPNSVECIMVPAAVVLVVVLHIMTMLLSDLSLSIKMIHQLKPELLCPMFLTSTEMFPRRIMGYIMVMVMLVIITSTTVILTNIKRRLSVISLGGTMQAGDVASLQHHFRPFVQPHLNNNALLSGRNQQVIDFNENTVCDNYDKGEHSSSTSQITVADDTSSSVDWSGAQDYNDYEHRRCRMQSAHPQSTLVPFAQVSPAHRGHAVQLQSDHQDLYPVHDAALPPNDQLVIQPVDRVVDDAPLPLLSDIILRIMFPHRSTVNKPRFPFTLARRSRRVTWPTSRDMCRRFDYVRPYPVDLLLCVSGVLFTVNYFPLAVYLIYTSEDQQYPFLESSFQPFLIILLLKNSIESLAYFIGIQCFPWLV